MVRTDRRISHSGPARVDGTRAGLFTKDGTMSKVNGRFWFWGGVFVLALGGMLYVQGCDAKKVIRTDVPVTVQKEEGLPPTLSLADNEEVYEDWKERVLQMDLRWRAEIAEGYETLNTIQNIVGAVFESETVQAGAASLPFGAVGLSALTFLAGAMGWKRKGDKDKNEFEAAIKAKDAEWAERLGAEKIASYNKGKKEGGKATT
jgi:hypothetical protein